MRSEVEEIDWNRKKYSISHSFAEASSNERLIEIEKGMQSLIKFQW